MSERNRSIKSYRRRRPLASPRSTILIVCEGEKTEPYYFNALKRALDLTNAEVEIAGEECGSAPNSVVKFAKKKQDLRKTSTARASFDHIWCVMDTEIPSHPTLGEALNTARSNKFCVALSNPCFEYWYILHFNKVAPYMQSADDCVKRLKRLMPAYEKNSDTIFVTLLPLTSTAMKNASELLTERYSGTCNDTTNPATNVQELVAFLTTVSKEPRP